MTEEEIISFDALWESMEKCKCSVGWKDSVASFYLNGISNILKLHEDLTNNTYKPRDQHVIQITHPKPRTAISISFRDRVYQRSLNDNAIFPAMSKQFIKENVACQKGKGTTYAMDLLKQYLQQAYRKYGLNLSVLQGDIRGYYPNMNHDMAEENFKRYLDPEIFIRAQKILRTQYDGDAGYNPGSQIVQIAGISVLSPMDHYIKEQLHIKWYERYQDDFMLIHPDADYLNYCMVKLKEFLREYHFELHPKKTRIYPITEGIEFLGFTHYLSDTGKVYRIIKSSNVKDAKRRLKRLVNLAKQGKRTRAKVDECFKAWKNHAKQGNCQHVIERMNKYYTDLWK